jgi:Cu/Ag efflux protein CusF
MRAFLTCLALLLAAGCSGREASGRDYTVRGQVRQLPDPAASANDLSIAHEAIDDWTTRDGTVQGMDPMTMPFEVAEEVSLDGIEVGDVIEFTLHVDWGAETEVEITRVRELPAGTKLTFREAKPPREP